MDISEAFSRMEISPDLQLSRLPSEWDDHNYDGCLIIPPADRRLEAVDLTNIVLPEYKQFSLYYLVVVLGYPAFAHNLQNKNGLDGRCLDRPTTDAAWMVLITLAYKILDPTKLGDALRRQSLVKTKTRLLLDAVTQTSNRLAAEYWRKKVERFGRVINVSSCLEPLTSDQKVQLARFLQQRANERETVEFDNEYNRKVQMIINQRWRMGVDGEERKNEAIAELKAWYDEQIVVLRIIQDTLVEVAGR